MRVSITRKRPPYSPADNGMTGYARPRMPAMKQPRPPHCAMDPDADGQLRLSGNWTLSTALQSAQLLRALDTSPQTLDARGIEQLDSAGVLQLLRFAHRAGLPDEALLFRDDHRALVCTIEEVTDERPKPQRD